MPSSLSKVLCLAVLAAQSAFAHTVFTNFYVDGVNQGDATCVRMNKDHTKSNYPVRDVTGSDMVCGFDGLTPVSRVCSVRDGATLTFEYRRAPMHPNSYSGQQAIDPGHVGPCSVYLKRIDSAHSSGEGDGWFKIFDEGYDEASGRWCNVMMDQNNNHLSVKLPKGLVGGYYLARPELLALHAVPINDQQFYTGCAQIFIHSDGNIVPDRTVSIPGYVSKQDAALQFNVYQTPMALPYPLPGPKPANFKRSHVHVAKLKKQTEGLKPKNCVLEVGNWCGMEVPSYNDQPGCWESSRNCWAQQKVCWNNAPTTGGDRCHIWETKCRNLDDQCKAGHWHGPPNKGKDWTPKPMTINIGQMWPTSRGGHIRHGHAGPKPTPKNGGVDVPNPSPKKGPKPTKAPSSPKHHHKGTHPHRPSVSVVTTVVYETVTAHAKRDVPVYRRF